MYHTYYSYPIVAWRCLLPITFMKSLEFIKTDPVGSISGHNIAVTFL